MNSNPLTHDSEDVIQAPEENFADILSEFEHSHQAAPESEATPSAGLKGTVIAVNADGVFIDIGRKTEGVLPLDKLKAADAGEVKAGDVLTVTVTGRNAEGYYELSCLKAARPKDWSALEKAFAEKTIIAGTVTEAVKGGLRVDVGAPAFMPASRSGVREMGDLEKLIGQEIRVRITKLDVAEEDVVVDRRSVVEEESVKIRDEAFANLKEGSTVRGTVRSLTEFGAFVDLGGVDGLLHVTDISWHRVANPADVLTAGESIDVKILKINPTTRKIGLGLKQLVPDPWTVAAEKFKIGERIKGKVVRLADFGAFVELDPGVDGLIHLSEMSWSRKVKKPADVVKVGDAVDVVVLGVNAAEKRIALGLKQALGDPWDEVGKKYPEGSVVEGQIVSIQKFGAFVDLGDGIEGMIHVGDISREKRIEHPKDVLTQNQTVKAQVLELDKSRRRIRLGMKQLEPTNADTFIAEHQVGETVTGRVVEVRSERAKIELGEGVNAECILAKAASKADKGSSSAATVDVSALSAMLNARWKSGEGNKTEGGADLLKPGQIRTFKITAFDASKKRIEVEIAN